jgi:hypothetical protein
MMLFVLSVVRLYKVLKLLILQGRIAGRFWTARSQKLQSTKRKIRRWGTISATPSEAQIIHRFPDAA